MLQSNPVLWREMAMDTVSKPTCRIVKSDVTYDGKQGLSYFQGIATETVGSKGICMHLLTMPPGARANSHSSGKR